MEANEIRKNGTLIKSWRQMDGCWYEDSYEIWRVGNKYYQIKSHESLSFSGTCSYWGRVMEVEFEGPQPTHIGVIVGQDNGQAYIYKQRQGTPEELTEWAVDLIEQNNTGYNGKVRNLVFKMMELNF